jgi:transketolase
MVKVLKGSKVIIRNYRFFDGGVIRDCGITVMLIWIWRHIPPPLRNLTMKKETLDIINELMDTNKDIYIIFCGLGWPRVDEFLTKYPYRAINTEASEQTALDISVGLSYEGKTPIVYTITPFLLRGFETIRTYINHENLNVILLGIGRDKDYAHDGFSHDASDIEMILRTQHNIFQSYPNTPIEIRQALRIALTIKGPNFISIPR